MLDFLSENLPISAALITFALATVRELAVRFFAARPKVVWSTTANTSNLVPQQEGPALHIQTRTLFFQNLGRAMAEELEIVFNFKPAHLERWPHLPISTQMQEDQRFVVTVARLNPRETMTLSLMAVNGDFPSISVVRCKGFPARAIAMAPMRVFGRPVILLVGALMLLGATAAVYILLQIFAWLIPLIRLSAGL